MTRKNGESHGKIHMENDTETGATYVVYGDIC